MSREECKVCVGMAEPSERSDPTAVAITHLMLMFFDSFLSVISEKLLHQRLCQGRHICESVHIRIVYF